MQRPLVAVCLLGSGKGIRVGDDGEEVPAYYHQWAAKIQDMSPARQADVLDQLGEDDRLIVQRILDHNVVQRSNDSAMSGLSQRHNRAGPASPTCSDSPPPYSAVAGSRAVKPVSRQTSRSASPQEEHRSSAQTGQEGRRQEDAHGASRRHGEHQKKKATSAVDMGIFDFDSQSSSELEQHPHETQARESQAAEAESTRLTLPRQQPQPEMQSQRQQQQGELWIPDESEIHYAAITKKRLMPCLQALALIACLELALALS